MIVDVHQLIVHLREIFVDFSLASEIPYRTIVLGKQVFAPIILGDCLNIANFHRFAIGIVVIVEDEFVGMTILPADDDLNDAMQLLESDVDRNLKLSPDEWLDAFDVDAELKRFRHWSCN